MKTMRRITALLILTVLLIGTVGLSGFAQETPFLRSYDVQSYVCVAGKLEAADAGYTANMMLVESNADLNSLTSDDIGYIGQSVIEPDGSYRFEFTFSDFTYNTDNQVNNYQVILNIAGEKMTETITKASVISELVQFDLDTPQFGSAVAQIENQYALQGLRYTMLIGFYTEGYKLLGITRADKVTGDDGAFTYQYGDIPQGTVRAKAFLWESYERSIPLADTKEIDVLGYTTNRSAMCLTIAPGLDETQRNFAWYDLPGIDGARIQYAVKTSEADLITFPEENAITAAGTCGAVDVTEYNGLALGEGKEDSIFKHEGDYSWAKATITDLEYGKTYVYRVGDQLGWCQGIYEFKTDATPEDGFRFILFSDEHCTNGSAAAPLVSALTKAVNTCEEPSFIFTMGDIMDLPWIESYYTSYFSRPALKSIPLAAVPGTTHDMLWSPREASLFGHHFNMPNQSKTSGYTKNLGGNYWYTYGDVLFIGIMHNGTGAAAIAETKVFIEQTVAENQDTKWRVLCSHFPFGYGLNTVNNYFPGGSDFIADNGIDIVFNGHLHQYFRTYQMYGGQPVNTDITNTVTDPEGTVYVSLNTTGFRAGSTGRDPSYMAVVGSNAVRYYSTLSEIEGYYTTHFSIASVKTTDTENSFTLTTYQNVCDRTTGAITDTKILDTYTITKSCQP